MMPLRRNERDVSVYQAIRKHASHERIYLVVQGEDGTHRVSRVGKVVALYVRRLRNPIFNHFWFILRAVLLGLRLRRHGVTMLQASDPTGGGVAAVLVKAMIGVPLLVHLQGELLTLPTCQFSWGRRIPTRYITIFVANAADRVRCVSRNLIRDAARAGVRQEKLVFVPSRCDTELFNPIRWKAEGQRLRDTWGLTQNSVVSIFVGGLSGIKGVINLPPAIQIVRQLYPNFVLVLVGSGELDSVLRRAVQELGIEPAVRFCGQVPYGDVPAYLAAADLFVFPSLTEGMPRAVLEAMAMGLPVVATRVGGVPELVRDRETGLLVEPADAKQLAAALSYVLEHPAEARKWGNRARAMVEAEYSFDAGTRAYATVLGELMAKAEIAAGEAVR